MGELGVSLCGGGFGRDEFNGVCGVRSTPCLHWPLFMIYTLYYFTAPTLFSLARCLVTLTCLSPKTICGTPPLTELQIPKCVYSLNRFTDLTTVGLMIRVSI